MDSWCWSSARSARASPRCCGRWPGSCTTPASCAGTASRSPSRSCSCGPTRSGYVAQLPRVLSGTVADNIRLGHEVDAVRGRRAEHDLRSDRGGQPVARHSRPGRAPGGGLGLLIGHKGTRLSGGQLQRLALARALAPRTELLVADDVSSALDVTTELELWQVLREHGRDRGRLDLEAGRPGPRRPRGGPASAGRPSPRGPGATWRTAGATWPAECQTPTVGACSRPDRDLAREGSPVPRVTATHLDGDRFEVAVRGHRLVVDQPTPDGDDAGPTPVELFVAGLTACVAALAGRYLARHAARDRRPAGHRGVRNERAPLPGGAGATRRDGPAGALGGAPARAGRRRLPLHRAQLADRAARDRGHGRRGRLRGMARAGRGASDTRPTGQFDGPVRSSCPHRAVRLRGASGWVPSVVW